MKRSIVAIVLVAISFIANADPVVIHPEVEPRTAPAPHMLSKHFTTPGIAADVNPVVVGILGCDLSWTDDLSQQYTVAKQAFGELGVSIKVKFFSSHGDAGACDPTLVYSTTSDAIDALRTYGNGPWADWRSTQQLDLVVLYRPDSRGSQATSCGVAYGVANQQLDAGLAYAVVEEGNCGHSKRTTLAHELGHLFGAAHGPTTDAGHLAQYGLYKFSNGFDGHNRNGECVFSIMAYGNVCGWLEEGQIPSFSSPSFTKLRSKRWPYGKYNNARTIRLAAPVIANYR